MIGFNQFTLKAGAPIFDPELLIARVRFAVARDTVDPEVSAIGLDHQPHTSDFDPISNGARFSEGAYQLIELARKNSPAAGALPAASVLVPAVELPGPPVRIRRPG